MYITFRVALYLSYLGEADEQSSPIPLQFFSGTLVLICLSVSTTSISLSLRLYPAAARAFSFSRRSLPSIILPTCRHLPLLYRSPVHTLPALVAYSYQKPPAFLVPALFISWTLC